LRHRRRKLEESTEPGTLRLGPGSFNETCSRRKRILTGSLVDSRLRFGVHRYQCDRDTRQTARVGLWNTVLIFCCTIGAVSSHGEDLTTTAGKTFHDVQVLSRSSSALLIQSREGQFQFPLTELKPADREKFSKDLTKAIELPAVTVIGEQKVDFSISPRGETIAQKEMQRQDEQKAEAHKKQVESYQPIQIFKGVTLSLGVTDPKNDLLTLPDYLNPDYGRESPDIVEKDIKVFRTSLTNQSQ
jgi:hypothetical protein